MSYRKSPRSFGNPAATKSVMIGLRSGLGISIVLIHLVSMAHAADEMKPVSLRSEIATVQPMTGIALWSTNPAASTAPIQLEFAYLRYDQVVREKDEYDWSEVEKLLEDIASRRHQAILRWHDTYVGKPNGVPSHIQRKALSETGPHGVPFEKQAAKFHVSFIIGDDQPNFQTAERIRMAGLACGYRFRVTRFECNSARSMVTIENAGVAPIYHDAYPAVDGVRSKQSLKGLLPGESRSFEIDSGGSSPALTIQSDRLVQGQEIQYEATLP